MRVHPLIQWVAWFLYRRNRRRLKLGGSPDQGG